MVVIAVFGTSMATIVPTAFSLTARIEQILPGRIELVGIIVGVGAAATLVIAPLAGQVSDRTRSRWGRRRPYALLGMLGGLLAVPALAFAQDYATLLGGWALAAASWATASGAIANWKAEYLAPQQRGSVSGISGLVMQAAPVVGIGVISQVGGSPLFMFAFPAAVGAAVVIGFLCVIRDPATSHLPTPHRVTVVSVLRSYGFRPSDHREFAWNWLGRLLFFVGAMSTSTFTVALFAQRLGMTVVDAAGILAVSSALALVTASIGSVGGGVLSDRTGARRPIVCAGAAICAVGTVLLAFAETRVSLIGGTLVTSFGMSIFAATGQALSLDLLPRRDTEAGRFTAISMFAQKVPAIVAPALAPLVLVVAAPAGSLNFGLLYLVAAGFMIAGGLVILVRHRRRA